MPGMRFASKSLKALSIAALWIGFAAPSRAHGPTVEITDAGLKPPLLNLFEGTTVHFSNKQNAPLGIVVWIDETGSVKSPVLRAPGDGWHHTFEKSGRYSVRLEQRPDAKMTIVVVPRKAP